MQKVISLFQRNYDTDRLVRNEVVPGAEWVISGEGVATRKWDGSCCLFRMGKLFKRYELKAGKTPPANFESAQDPDPVTGAVPGWVPVGDGPEDQWFRAAMENTKPLIPGTYEAIGPHFGGGHHSKNPEGCQHDILVQHGQSFMPLFPRDFEGIRAYFAEMGAEVASIEGVVWHHPDGRMVKVKAKDFGVKRK